MRLEFIDRVKVEEVLGKNILTNDGQILLRAGVKLTRTYIKKLKELGVLYVYVEDDRLIDIQPEDDMLSNLKQSTMKNMSSIIKNVYISNKQSLKESLKIVEDLICYIIEMGDVNKSLYDVKTHDNYTYLHSLDTGIMAAFLGLSLDFSDEELKELGIGSILHDIGKVKVSQDIICKTGSLTIEEYEEIKKHPIYGREILEKNFFLSENIIRTVEEHHERIDGTGYPKGLKGNNISKFAKVTCICDVYDAVSNDRSYRTKFSPNEAYELILAGSGNYFDKNMVEKFKKTFAVYPLGCCLRLCNGIEGYVVRQNGNFPDRPVIRVLYDSKSMEPINSYEINLLSSINLSVEKVV